MLTETIKSSAEAKGLLRPEEQLDVEIAFLLIRDMPYARTSSRDPETTIREWRGTCSGKLYLLKQLFAELGYSSRLIACTAIARLTHKLSGAIFGLYWNNPNGRFFDVHNYLLLELLQGQMIVDATWPISIDGMGTVVNRSFVLGQDQQITCEPIQTLEVPEDQDPQAFKEKISRMKNWNIAKNS